MRIEMRVARTSWPGCSARTSARPARAKSPMEHSAESLRAAFSSSLQARRCLSFASKYRLVVQRPRIHGARCGVFVREGMIFLGHCSRDPSMRRMASTVALAASGGAEVLDDAWCGWERGDAGWTRALAKLLREQNCSASKTVRSHKDV
jgi:hypothetical protein